MSVLLVSDNAGLQKRPRNAQTSGGLTQEAMTPMPDQPIPYGYCHCGCGQKTRISHVSDASKGWVRGEPRLYLKHHGPHRRARGPASPNWQGDSISYTGAHKRLEYYAVKTGICDCCGPARKTQWAYKGEPGGWSADMSDYRELCVPCHKRYDVEKAGRATGGPCSVDDCDGRVYARGLCERHYSRIRRREAAMEAA